MYSAKRPTRTGRKTARMGLGRRGMTALLVVMSLGMLAAAGWMAVSEPAAAGAPAVSAAAETVTLFDPLTSSRYDWIEKISLVSLVFVALAGLAYAWMLVGQVKSPPRARRGCRKLPALFAKAPMPTSIGSSAWWAC